MVLDAKALAVKSVLKVFGISPEQAMEQAQGMWAEFQAFRTDQKEIRAALARIEARQVAMIGFPSEPLLISASSVGTDFPTDNSVVIDDTKEK